MKKYIAPSVNVADIENEVILAGSNFGVNKGDNGYGKDDFSARDRGLFDWNTDEE